MIDNSFTIKTSDPGRAFDPTASMIDRAIYDTLFTYKGGDLAHPIPLLVSSLDGEHERGDVHLPAQEERPLRRRDAADLGRRRLVAASGSSTSRGTRRSCSPGISISAPGKYTVVMHSKTPDTELPVDPREPVDRHPQLGARDGARRLRRRERREGRHGRELAQLAPPRSARAAAPTRSAPTASPRRSRSCPSTNYWGAKKPAFSSVVVRNMIAPTQLLNVARDSHEIAIDLSADQAQTLKGNKNVNVSLQPSTWIFFLMANNNPKVSTVTSNKDYQTGDPLRARLRLARQPRRAGRDPGARADPVDVPRRAAPERRRSRPT